MTGYCALVVIIDVYTYKNFALSRFRDTYLSGASGAAENFRKFRGRDPSPDAFLLWLGLQKPLKPALPK